MRPNQQNKNRSRGRNNNNGGRKHSNPLSRSFESNGPDVKVRGNASHIAEKYVQLARDAQTSGDSVMAENYFQHAEHYFRIISAAQAAMPPRQDQNAQGNQGQANQGQGNQGQAGQAPSNQEQPSQQAGDNAEASGEDGSAPDHADAAAVSQPVAEDDAPQAEGEKAAAAEEGEKASERPRRERRPRRRKVTEPTENAEGDKANAPQPDVGELPAFLTGTPASAAE